MTRNGKFSLLFAPLFRRHSAPNLRQLVLNIVHVPSPSFCVPISGAGFEPPVGAVGGCALGAGAELELDWLEQPATSKRETANSKPNTPCTFLCNMLCVRKPDQNRLHPDSSDTRGALFGLWQGRASFGTS
jgi:hypothetical protein